MSPLEKCARAIDPYPFDESVPYASWDRVSEQSRARRAARACLEAIREPEQSLIDAANAKLIDAGEPVSCVPTFRAVIDHILSQ